MCSYRSGVRSSLLDERAINATCSPSGLCYAALLKRHMRIIDNLTNKKVPINQKSGKKGRSELTRCLRRPAALAADGHREAVRFACGRGALHGDPVLGGHHQGSASAKSLRDFIEDAKASGLIDRLLEKNGAPGMTAPRVNWQSVAKGDRVGSAVTRRTHHQVADQASVAQPIRQDCFAATTFSTDCQSSSSSDEGNASPQFDEQITTGAGDFLTRDAPFR